MSEEVLASTFAGFGVRDVAVHAEPGAAVERVTTLYEQATARLVEAFHRFTRQGTTPQAIDAFYPFLGIRVEPGDLNLDGRLAYGALHDPGIYGTTLTQPRLFGDYYRTQVGILIGNQSIHPTYIPNVMFVCGAVRRFTGFWIALVRQFTVAMDGQVAAPLQFVAHR